MNIAVTLLTLDRAAETLATCKRTVMRAIHSGKLRVVKIGKSVRVHPEDLDQFINHNRRYISQPCQSENVVTLGTLTCKSPDNALEQRLAKGQTNSRRSNSKPR